MIVFRPGARRPRTHTLREGYLYFWFSSGRGRQNGRVKKQQKKTKQPDHTERKHILSTLNV